MQRVLKSFGLKGEKGFDDAEKDMKEAEGDLKGGKGQEGDEGSPKPERASRQGRGGGRAGPRDRGASRRRAGHAEADGSGSQGRDGKRGSTARRMRPGERPGDDPLGRGREGNLGRDEGSLRELGGVTERARRVMEELRRRLADPNRANRRAGLSRTADEAGLRSAPEMRNALTRVLRREFANSGAFDRARGPWFD